MSAGWPYRLSAMLINLGIAACATVMVLAVGVVPFIVIHLPSVILAATLGLWLLYVQHQFDEAH